MSTLLLLVTLFIVLLSDHILKLAITMVQSYCIVRLKKNDPFRTFIFKCGHSIDKLHESYSEIIPSLQCLHM